MPFFSSRQLLPLFIVAAVGLLLAACGSDEPAGDCLVPEDGSLVAAPCEVPAGVTAEPTPTPPPSNDGGSADPGFAAFRSAGCAGCHTVDGTSAAGVAGPNLTTVGAKGAAYVEESIRNPSAVIAEGFEDRMPPTFGATLSDADIKAIVDWLVSQ